MRLYRHATVIPGKVYTHGNDMEEIDIDYEAAVEVFRKAGYKNKGLRILLDQAINAALDPPEET